ncbi:MAG: crossover junction endodeoxyribonuclease RuvC [Alphaproteobacteria bacterium]|nr:crossover junction endodeoxyribonuclease RuvC [Alphaproteobacteria bacterium]MCB9697284.1 crossover junction endodeoxyribonuclease RuvC [Alphaproteobacteria bacterium]
MGYVRAMIVFGIDPGSTVTGWGAITAERGRLRLVDGGCVRTDASWPMEERLLRIHDGLLEALERIAPEHVAIEAIFRHKSSESALRLGQARGVALLAVGRRGLRAAEYNAMTVKKTVGATGAADKEQVARVVRMLLGELPKGPADTTDALAIAITHHAHLRNGLR